MKIIKELGFEHLPMLSEFVKAVEGKYQDAYSIATFPLTATYTDFITQPLTKGMFIPCDEDGNVLAPVMKPIPKPKGMIGLNSEDVRHGNEYHKYQQAKDRVLFEGWEYVPVNTVNYHVMNKEGVQIDFFSGGLDYHKTIEQAINAGVKLKLKI